MSVKRFTTEEQSVLRKNIFVLKISDKAITYTDEFKIHFIAEYNKGKTPRRIFKEAEFDVDIIGIKRVSTAANRWKKAYKENGVLGLSDTRKGNSGRPLERKLSTEEIIERKDVEIAYLKAELELVKKLELEERQVTNGRLNPSYMFDLIEEIITRYNLTGFVRHLCKVATVSKSGYYRHLKTRETRKESKERDLADFKLILRAYKFKNVNKGSRGIYMVLKEEFKVIFNRKKIQRLMRIFNLRCPIRKANPYKRISKANREHSVVPNLLNRKFKNGNPAQILLTDITYLPFKGSFAYLSVVKDSVTNEILSHHLSKNIKLEIAMNTIDKLIQNHKNRLAPDAYIHSDQGVHYTSPLFQNKLKLFGIGQSMSRKGNCWDNAPMESFFGHMKDEIHFKSCDTFEDLEIMIDEYMEYYNTFRYQWKLKKLTPVMYRNQLLAA